MTVTIELASELEHQLQAEAAASGVNAEEFVLDTVTARLKRTRIGPVSSDCLPIAEARLLQEINRGPDEATWQRYRHLVQQRQDEAISVDDLAELVRLSDFIEVDHVRRLQAVSELALQRGIPFEALMKQMGQWRSTDA